MLYQAGNELHELGLISLWSGYYTNILYFTKFPNLFTHSLVSFSFQSSNI